MNKSILVIISIIGIFVAGVLAFATLGAYQEPKLEITGLKPEYTQGDLATIIVNYDGEKSGCQMPKIQVSNSTNPSQLYVDYAGGYHPDCPNQSFVEFYAGVDGDKSIDHTQDFHVLVKLGKTTFEKDVAVYFDSKKKFYTSIDFPDMESTYQVNTAVNFTISLRGHGLFNAGLIPQAQVFDQSGGTIWASFDHSDVTCCPRELFDLSRDFVLSDIGNPLIINSAGTYTVQANYGGTIAQKSFEVVLPEIHCKDMPKPISNITLKKYTWIAVSQVRQPFKADCIDVENIIYDTPKLVQAIRGADGCLDGTILCTIPKGVGEEVILNNGLSASDFEQYKLSLSDDEAESFVKKLGIDPKQITAYQVLKYKEKYYLLFFFNTDQSPDIEAIMEFDDDVSLVPVKLEKGQSITYPMTVKTLATYGKQKARIDLSAGISAQDSLVSARIEPSTLELGECMQAKVNLIISAQKEPRDGIYRVWANGKSGEQHLGPWNHLETPSVQIGNLGLEITTSGIDSTISLGGKSPPDWLRVELQTDHDLYQSGNDVKIMAYLVNDGDQKITLNNNTDMALRISAIKKDKTSIVYGIRAYSFDNKEPLTIEPKSKIVLARPFYWDQTMLSVSNSPTPVDSGVYELELDFSGYQSYVFHAQKRIGLGIDNQELLQPNDKFGGITITIPEKISESADPVLFSDITANPGTQFRWKNEDFVPHTATSIPGKSVDTFDTEIIYPGKFSKTITLDKPGLHEYFDNIHPWVQGKITIKVK